MTELTALGFAVRELCGSASPKGLGQLQGMVGTADGQAGCPSQGAVVAHCQPSRAWVKW